MRSEYQDYGYTNSDSPAHHPELLRCVRKKLGDTSGPVLDLGCGNGWMSLALLREGFDIYGVDASEQGIRIANTNAPGRFHVMNFTEEVLPPTLCDIPFRTLVCTEVIAHLYSPRILLDLARNILTRNGGGRLIISTPYHGYWKNLALALTGKIDSHFCVLWDGGVIKFFSIKTLTQMLQEQGFRVTQISGAGRFKYFWMSMVITAAIDVND